MEIELKLAVHLRHAVCIRRHPLFRNIEPQRRALLSVYFDTPQFDLMRRHIALRMRRVDEQWMQTLKAETKSVGALTSRPEWEVVVADGSQPDFSSLPLEALDLLAGIQLKQIAPVFTTEFQRTTWQIGNPQAQAEVALDSGKILAAEASLDISEVEIELKSGSPEFLFDLAVQLLERVPLQVEPRSKAQRGYTLCGAIKLSPSKMAYPDISRDQVASEAWHAIMQAALVQLTANVPGFLEQAHDSEYLHQLRVAMRRLLSGAVLVKSLRQPVPQWYQPLRELMAALNAARDWDVFLQQTLPAVPPLSGASPENHTIGNAALELMHDAALRARQQAQALLREPEFARLILDIGRSLLTPPIDMQQRDTGAWSETVLNQRWQKLNERCRGFAKLNPQQRHRARIAAKKMRYVADAFAPVYGKQVGPFMAALSALQDELGYANDLIVGQQLLQRLPKRSAKLGFALGRICGVLEGKAAEQTGLSGGAWKPLARSKLFWHS